MMVMLLLIFLYKGLDITRDGIIVVKDYTGKSSGDAFVKFASREGSEKALAKHKDRIGHRYGSWYLLSFLSALLHTDFLWFALQQLHCVLYRCLFINKYLTGTLKFTSVAKENMRQLLNLQYLLQVILPIITMHIFHRLQDIMVP